MAYDSLSVSEIIPARPERIYAAWLSSDEHTAFTGDKAVVEPFVGGKHSTFDGYANGHTVELQPGKRIVQTWRAEDFPLGSPDSRVEVTLEETVGGTMVTILHTARIPSGQGSRLPRRLAQVLPRAAQGLLRPRRRHASLEGARDDAREHQRCPQAPARREDEVLPRQAAQGDQAPRGDRRRLEEEEEPEEAGGPRRQAEPAARASKGSRRLQRRRPRPAAGRRRPARRRCAAARARRRRGADGAAA